ncbi:TRAP transporter large permease [Salipiger bermudensis]|uniref:TRAP transporter large permease n=1 Tax=Salipiger bermudensis TaxID=344736 RepID=UPI001A8ECF3B|nr:TRAP transporter large permease [Salipiger bermudensis]MBN9675115.1 TRAP transporter large permease [Salipiger bermudensis]
MAIALILTMIFLIAIGLPVAFAMLLSATGFMALAGIGMPTLPVTLFSGSASFVILAVPLFILMGEIMSSTSIAARLIDLSRALVGWMSGGLAHVNVVSSMLMAEMSGSAVADAAMMGKLFVPQMERAGYPRAFSVSVTAASAIIGIIIPPSIAMVIFGAVSNTSIRDLFLAGLAPGIGLGIVFMITNRLFARRENHPRDAAFAVAALLAALRRALVPLLIPVVVIGGLIGGIVTPTEAAAIGVIASLLYGFVLRELSLATLWRLLVSTSHQSASILIIVAASAILGQVLANEQVPQRLAAQLGDTTESAWLLLLYINLLLLVAGMFLQATAAIIVVVPVLMPVVLSFGIDPVHFGILTCVNLAIGQQTPPVATVLMTVCGITRTPIKETFPYMVWYLAAMFVVLAVVTYLPLMV